GPPFRMEFRLRTRDGEYRWFETRGDLLCDDEGRPLRLAGFLSDITTRKQAEQALRESENARRESEQRFHEAFEHAPIGMALVGAEYRLLLVNKALCHILGYEAEELLTRTFVEITHPDDLDKDTVLFNALIQGTMPHYALEKRYFRKGGSIVW